MNGAPIDWRQLFTIPAGRTSRGPFWIAVATLFTLFALYEAVAGPDTKLLTFWFVYPLLLASGACVLSKRLHDRGRSGWWAALVLFAFAAEWARPFGFSGVAYILVLAWAAIELGVMQGEDGANRFGPSPMALAV